MDTVADDTISLEINLTEAEINKLISESSNDETTMCARTVYGSDLRFCFDGFYPNKGERIEAIKQSLRNIGLVEGKSVEGFFSKFYFLNIFEQKALLRGFKARYFFFLVDLFRLQDHLARGLALECFHKNNSFLPKDSEEKSKEGETTQYRNTLFERNFTLRTSYSVNQAVKQNIQSYEKPASTAPTGLCKCGWSKQVNVARYRLSCILVEKDLLRQFCYDHFRRKRAASFELLEEQQSLKKVKTEATVSKKGISCPCYLPEARFQSKEVKQEYKEMFEKRKEPVAFQPKLWCFAIIYSGIVEGLAYFFDMFILDVRKKNFSSFFMIFISSLFTTLFISTHRSRGKFDLLLYPVLVLSIICLELTDYLLVRSVGVFVCALSVWLTTYKWKLAWIPLAVGIVLNWQLSWVPWKSSVKAPLVLLSYWNQHRQKQENFSSLLMAPYRDWLIIVVTIVSSAIFCNPA